MNLKIVPQAGMSQFALCAAVFCVYQRVTAQMGNRGGIAQFMQRGTDDIPPDNGVNQAFKALRLTFLFLMVGEMLPEDMQRLPRFARARRAIENGVQSWRERDGKRHSRRGESFRK